MSYHDTKLCIRLHMVVWRHCLRYCRLYWGEIFKQLPLIGWTQNSYLSKERCSACSDFIQNFFHSIWAWHIAQLLVWKKFHPYLRFFPTLYFSLFMSNSGWWLHFRPILKRILRRFLPSPPSPSPASPFTLCFIDSWLLAEWLRLINASVYHVRHWPLSRQTPVFISRNTSVYQLE